MAPCVCCCFGWMWRSMQHPSMFKHTHTHTNNVVVDARTVLLGWCFKAYKQVVLAPLYYPRPSPDCHPTTTTYYPPKTCFSVRGRQQATAGVAASASCLFVVVVYSCGTAVHLCDVCAYECQRHCPVGGWLGVRQTKPQPGLCASPAHVASSIACFLVYFCGQRLLTVCRLWWVGSGTWRLFLL